MIKQNIKKNNPFNACFPHDSTIKIGETKKNSRDVSPHFKENRPQNMSTFSKINIPTPITLSSLSMDTFIPKIQKQLWSGNSIDIHELHDSVKLLQESMISFHEEFKIMYKEEGNTQNNLVRSMDNIVSYLQEKFPHSDISYYNMENNIILLKRLHKKNIMLQIYNDESVVTKSSILAFVQLLSETNNNGIVVSRFGEFETKSDYTIENSYGNMLIYIHNMENDGIQKLLLAVNVNDIIAQIMVHNEKNINYYCIEKNMLHDIYKEYEDFHRERQELIDSFKQDYKKKITSLQHNFKCVSLEELLSKNLMKIPKNEVFKCSICNNYNAQNLKALSAHKRGCCKKNKALSPNYVSEDYKEC
jgi:hypothetical protein